MQIISTLENPTRQLADAIVVGVFHEGLSQAAEELDRACGGSIHRLFEIQEFKPDIGRTANLYFLPGVASPVVTLVGCGARSAWGRGAAFRAASTASRVLTEKPRESIVFALDSDLPPEIAESAVVGSLAALLLEALVFRGLHRLLERRRGAEDATPPPPARWSWQRLIGQYLQPN